MVLWGYVAHSYGVLLPAGAGGAPAGRAGKSLNAQMLLETVGVRSQILRTISVSKTRHTDRHSSRQWLGCADAGPGVLEKGAILPCCKPRARLNLRGLGVGAPHGQLTTSAAGSALALLIACKVFLFGGFCAQEVPAMRRKVHSDTEVRGGVAKMETKASRIRFLAIVVSLGALCLSL